MQYKFSPKYFLVNIKEENVIEAFKERIEGYYFRPIEMLLNEEDFGFAATGLLSNLIDVFDKTMRHDPTNNNNKDNYTAWVENNLGFDSKLAVFFYKNFRCGLLHSGCVESGGQISYILKNMIEYDNNHIIVNPRQIFLRLKKVFKTFMGKEDPTILLAYLKKRVSELI